MAQHQAPKRNVLAEGKELGNASRNERQKNVLLQEIGRIRRNEIDAVVGRSKQIIEQSKRLCESAAPKTHPGKKHSA